MECIPGDRRKRGRPKKNVDGRCMSSHENKTFRSRSVVKQKGMVCGFRKTATVVTRPERYIYIKAYKGSCKSLHIKILFKHSTDII